MRRGHLDACVSWSFAMSSSVCVQNIDMITTGWSGPSSTGQSFEQGGYSA